jgi:hypothetical protein
MVDRILVLPATSLRREPADVSINVNDSPQLLEGCSKAVLAQPLQFNLVAVSKLLANEQSPTPPDHSPVLTILMDITAVAAKGEAFLQFSFNGIDFAATQPESFKALISDSATQNNFLTLVSARIPSITRKIDFVDSLYSVPILQSVTLAITNAGVTASNSGEILLLRVEVNGAADQALDWTTFYTTYNRNLVGDGNWAMLIDKGILIPCIKNTISASLAAAKDHFAQSGGIDVKWKPSVGPVFEIEFSGEVIDACTCLWGEIDVNVDVSSTAVLEAGTNDTLYMGVNTTYDANDAEVACCALTASTFWPVVGLIYMGKDEGSINIGTYLLGYIMSPIGFTFMAVCDLASNQSITKYLTLPGGCEKVDDEMFSCQWPFTPNMGAFGGTYHLTKVSAQADGPVLSGTVAGITELGDPELAIKSVTQFAWYLGGSCSTGFTPQSTARVLYYNAAYGTIFKVCDVAVLEDPLHVFKITNVGAYSTSLRAVVTNAYLANPYQCKLRIVSNGGVRMITLAPAKDITPQEKAKLQDEAQLAKKLCHAVSITVPKKIIKWMQPDPAVPFTVDHAQIWQVVVAELSRGESVDLLVDDRTMASADAHGRGVAQLSFWSEGKYQNEIGLMLQVLGRQPTSAERDERNPHVSVKQTLLLQRSRVGFDGELDDMSLVRDAGCTLLSIRTSVGEVVYDISLPPFPSLRSSRMRAGTIARRFIVREGLYGIHLGEEVSGAIMANVAVEGIARIEPVKLAGVRRTVALTDGSGVTRILDLRDPNNPREIARYFHSPWFVDLRRSGRIFAKLAADGKGVSIYEMQSTLDS